MRAAWKNGARDLYEELRAQKVPESEHAEFVQWACRRLEKNALTNKSPKSLIFLVGTFRANQRMVEFFEDSDYSPDDMVICEKCEHLVYSDRVEEGLCLDCRTLLGWEDDYMKASV